MAITSKRFIVTINYDNNGKNIVEPYVKDGWAKEQLETAINKSLPYQTSRIKRVTVKLGGVTHFSSLEAEHRFYREFHAANSVALMQYKHLRANFRKLVEDVLGKDYYNTTMDVYDSDQACCEDIATKANMSLLQKVSSMWEEFKKSKLTY